MVVENDGSAAKLLFIIIYSVRYEHISHKTIINFTWTAGEVQSALSLQANELCNAQCNNRRGIKFLDPTIQRLLQRIFFRRRYWISSGQKKKWETEIRGHDKRIKWRFKFHTWRWIVKKSLCKWKLLCEYRNFNLIWRGWRQGGLLCKVRGCVHTHARKHTQIRWSSDKEARKRRVEEDLTVKTRENSLLNVAI
jgi:hypothetical protein